MIISLIAAMAHDRIIGLDNKMPWHIPADLAWFKKNTLGKPVIMGRKTFESIGRPLPNRHNIVISRTPQQSESGKLTWVNSLDAAFELVKEQEEVFILGGGNIYKQALPIANRLYLTQIDAKLAGDTQFPDYKADNWQKIYEEKHLADDKNPYNYTFEILSK